MRLIYPCPHCQGECEYVDSIFDPEYIEQEQMEYRCTNCGRYTFDPTPVEVPEEASVTGSTPVRSTKP